ncbi:MAG: EAL domain-containing protein [Methylophaga sp.]|nr:EAL domain-containing protein [Methylophaga sp.]
MTSELSIENTELTQTILNASPTPFIVHNKQKEIVYVNDAFTAQFGYTLKDISTPDKRGTTIYSNREYACKIKKIWEQHLKEGIQNNIFKPLEVQLRCKNGDCRTIIAHATHLPESANNLLISLHDITRHKQNEEMIQLASTVFQHSGEGMLVTSAEKNIIAINPAFSSITNFSEADVLNKPASILISKRYDSAFLTEVNSILELSGQWQGEVWVCRKKGEEILVWSTINTIYNEDGSVKQRVTLFSDITEKRQAELLALKQANYDPLTSLPNRTFFFTRLEEEIKNSNITNKPLAIFFLDLDGFKVINDAFGHPVGDKLLIEAGKRIADTAPNEDSVARFGGDEFTVLLPNLNDLNRIALIADTIITSLNQPFQIEGNLVYISASIGITIYPDDALTADDLLRNADQAMYFAKDAGRSRYFYFTQQMQRSSIERFSLTNDLREALELNQLEVYYQPIVYLPTKKIQKAEALLRWNHPERGMVSPSIFIPLAEETGLINEIGNWVFHQAVQHAQLFQQHNPDFQVSVNVSPVQFKAQNDWTSAISEVYFSSCNLVIEITESLLVKDDRQIIDQLLDFRTAGIQVAIDDFGTGYASLSYLNKFDIDYLKIDQSFIQNLSTDSSEMALSEAIIVMAHKLGLKVIAEGVETEQQSGLLYSAGCDFVQGHLFSQPLPVNKLLGLLSSEKSSESALYFE